MQPGKTWTDPQDKCNVCECHNNKVECARSALCTTGRDDVYTTPAPKKTASPPPYLTPPKPVKPVKQVTAHPPTDCITSHYTPWMNTSAPNIYGMLCICNFAAMSAMNNASIYLMYCVCQPLCILGE